MLPPASSSHRRSPASASMRPASTAFLATAAPTLPRAPRSSTCRRRPRARAPGACAPPPSDAGAKGELKIERDAVGPPMRWGRIAEGEKCTYCDDAELVDCPSCNGLGYHGRTITCRYCSGRKQLACPLCVEDDPYAWSYRAGAGDEAPPPVDGDALE